MLNTKNVFAAVIFGLLTVAVACVKTEFDEPPITGSPVDLVPNTTIKALKALHVTPEGIDRITDDLIIKGIVVADDRSGNYYKTIILQDETGGIEVKFNDGFLYNQYPIGREVFIKVKGMILTDYNGLPQLQGGTKEEAGAESAVGITEAQARTQILRGLVGQSVTPRAITLSEVSNPDFVNTLVTIADVQFIKADTGKTYADAVTKNSLNRTLQDCNSLELIVRTSGYADFAGSKTAGGKGSITGILSAFGSTPQLYIRNLNDVSMSAARCVIFSGGGPKGAVGTAETINETFNGGAVNVDITQGGWLNYASDGSRWWRTKEFSQNKYAEATAFSSQDNSNEVWLISPTLTISTQKVLSFESSWAYYKHQGLTVWYSTNFDGTNVLTATWTQITNATIAAASDGSGNFGNWIPSGNINLPVINGGKINIAFRYVGDGDANTTNWRIDNVKVQ
jgi:Family of unknown function (DUF5689)/Domain of unknown function (DUF5017)